MREDKWEQISSKKSKEIFFSLEKQGNVEDSNK